MRNRIRFYRPSSLAAVALIFVCLLPCAGRTKTPTQTASASAANDKLADSIDRQTKTITSTRSPAARQAMQMSLSRFYQWVDAYCDNAEALKNPSEGNLRCTYGEYFNYFNHIPQSIYSIGPWTVYETTAYGLLWGGIDPLDQDLHRPPGQLHISVPHVDAEPTPLSSRMSSAMTEQLRSLASGWAVEGWQLSLSVRIETINRCYLSVGIEQSAYTGGAHPNEYFQSFNWNRASDAPLNLADLFKPGLDWRHTLHSSFDCNRLLIIAPGNRVGQSQESSLCFESLAKCIKSAPRRWQASSSPRYRTEDWPTEVMIM